MARRDNSEVPYALGRTPAETARLMARARLVARSTRRLFEDAGLAAGMRVLDVGSGAGDVALLAAEVVGPAGAVVGVDTNPAILETARQRARGLGLANVTFLAGDIRDVAPGGAFDAVVGRYVLVWTPDPAAALRAAVRHLRPGGIVAFQESDFAIPALAEPPSPLLEQLGRWYAAFWRQTGFETRMGFKLYPTFLDAGLPGPQMRFEASMGGGADYDGYQRLADVTRSVLPQFIERGIATAEEVGVETLAARLRDEIAGRRGVLLQQPFALAWARKA